MSVDTILDDLRACETEDQVEATATKYREAVRLMERDPGKKVRAIHIKNLKQYMLRKIRSEKKGR